MVKGAGNIITFSSTGYLSRDQQMSMKETKLGAGEHPGACHMNILVPILSKSFPYSFRAPYIRLINPYIMFRYITHYQWFTLPMFLPTFLLTLTSNQIHGRRQNHEKDMRYDA